jgi:glycine cleavage system pyridoxal-binding protein P
MQVSRLHDGGPVSQWSLRRPFGPQKIMYTQTLKIKDRMSESQLLRHMESLAQKNHAKKSFIGMGYVR